MGWGGTSPHGLTKSITHHAVLQTREEVSSLQAVLDAPLRTVVSLELDHVSLEQPLTEAVLVTPFILPVLKYMSLISLTCDIT